MEGRAGKIKDIKTQAELKGRLDVCIKNMISVKQAVHENLTDDYRKIIVFLNNVESKENALEMFKDVFPNANFYDVDYSKSRNDNNSQIEKFKADDNRAVLFAVDMLNEGVHIKGTDCIIMFRKTVSPQIYLQQLGRGLASRADKMPVIFDFVSNTKNIVRKYKSESDSSPIIKEWNKEIEKEKQIFIKSYVLDFEEVLQNISECMKWTKDEEDFLKENYGKMSILEMSNKLGRTKSAISSRLRDLGISKTKEKPWSEKEDEFLKENINRMTQKEIAEILGRNIGSVAKRVSKLSLTKERRTKLTHEDIEYIKNNYGKIKNCEIARTLQCSKEAVSDNARKQGIRRTNRKFTEFEDSFIKENWGALTSYEVAEKLKRARDSVCKRAGVLGVTKSPRYSNKELSYIKSNYGKLKVENIAKHLGRTPKSVSIKASRMGLANKT